MSHEISAADVRTLREQTGVGMMDCKNALVESKGSIAEAIEILRKKGIASASKKSSRAAKEGLVSSYIHGEGRVGVLVEVNCETDFVARTEQFKSFVRDIAMHIAAASPQWVASTDVPEDLLMKEKEIAYAQAAGKPAAAMEKIVEGKIRKFCEDQCLLDQAFVKDSSKTVEKLRQELVLALGENIAIRRFSRFVLGTVS